MERVLDYHLNFMLWAFLLLPERIFLVYNFRANAFYLVFEFVYLYLLLLGLPWWLSGKESTYNAGDPVSISGSGRSPGEGNGNPFQYSCLENSMDRGAWIITNELKYYITNEWHNLTEGGKIKTNLGNFEQQYLAYTVDSWTTQIWTALVHLYGDFFQ